MKKFIGLLLVLCLFNFLSGLGGGGGDDQPNFPLIYIDEGVGGTHVGSVANPYDDLSDINWDGGGDNDISVAVAGNEDVVIHLMEGDEWREQLTIGTSGSAAHPIIIRSYGSDVKPIINGSDLITGWTEYGGGGGDVLLFADFEEGDLTDWDSTTADGDGLIVAHGDAAYEGSWGSRHYNNGAGDHAYGEVSDTALTEFSYRFEIKIADMVMADGDTFYVVRDLGGRSMGQCYIQRDGADYQVRFSYRDTDTGVGVQYTDWTNISKTEWNTFQYYYKRETGEGNDDGICVVYVNEVEILNNTACVGEFEQSYGQWTLGFVFGMDAGTIGYLYLDNVYFWDGEPPSGGDDVWQAACAVAEPPQVFFDGTRGNKQTGTGDVDSEYDWYWDSDVLYVFSDGSPDDPDDKYTSPGIEASVRDRAINIESKVYITMEDLELRYAADTMLRIVDSSNGFVIDNCHVQKSATHGIIIWGSNVEISSGLIKNCYVHDNYRVGVGLQHDATGPTGVTIENNVVADNGKTYPSQGIYLSRASSNVIRYNLISGSGANGIQFQFGSDSNEFYYNLVYENGAVGILCGAGDGGNSNEIYNNIVFNNGQSGFHLADGVALGNLIKNNIIYQDTGVVGSDASCIRLMNSDDIAGNTFDYNCYLYANKGGDIIEVGTGATTWYTLAEWQALGSSPDPNSINSDPHMIDLANDDFRLLMASPCIDAGVDVGLLVDYLGIALRHTPDIGAYENQTNTVFMARLFKYLKETK